MIRLPGLLKRFIGFSGLQLLSSLAPLVLLPVLARAAGAPGWASIAVGQSIGILVAAVAMYGWGVVGPVLVAAGDEGERWYQYRASLVSRIALLAITLPIGCTVALVTAAPGFRAVSVLMVCAQSFGALSPAWYAIGIGRPSLIMSYDTGPRLIAVLTSAGLLLLGAPLITYPILLLVSYVAGTALVTLRLSRTRGPEVTQRYGPSAMLHDIKTTLVTQAAPAGAQIAGASYGGATVAVVGIFATTAATAEFASADKLYRFSLTAVVAVGNTFQGWVAELPFPQSRRRMGFSLATLGAIGLTGGLALFLLGHWATTLLFDDALAASARTSLWYGVAFLAICLSTSLGRHILVPLGKTKHLLNATILGAVIGLPAMAFLSKAFGASGGAAGYAVSEVVGTSILALIVWRSVRRTTTAPGAGDDGKDIHD